LSKDVKKWIRARERVNMKKVSFHIGAIFTLFICLPLSTNSFAQQNLPLDQQTADKRTYLADLSEELNKRFPHNRRINIICVGHSVPAGYTKTPLVDTFSAYPYLLHRELKKKYPYAMINVIVSAQGSENSNAGLARFKKDVLQFSPDLITIDYGLTDILIGPHKSRTNLQKMIEMAVKAGSKVLLLTPTPDRTFEKNNLNHVIHQQAEQIRKLAMEYKIGLADSAAAFQQYVQRGGNLKDVLSNAINHPNRKGHQIVAGELLKWFPN